MRVHSSRESCPESYHTRFEAPSPLLGYLHCDVCHLQRCRLPGVHGIAFEFAIRETRRESILIMYVDALSL